MVISWWDCTIFTNYKNTFIIHGSRVENMQIFFDIAQFVSSAMGSVVRRTVFVASNTFIFMYVF